MSRIKPNSLAESVLFRQADKLLSGQHCEASEINELQVTLMSRESRSETLRHFVFDRWREIESNFLSVADGTGRMPDGVDYFLSFDRFFLRPLATRVSDNDLRQFAEVGLKHLFWLSHVGPMSKEHVQVARHVANLLKWTVGKFLASSRQDLELAKRVSLGINGVLDWVNTPTEDLNGSIRSFQAADELLRVDLPWEQLDCKTKCQQVFLIAQAVLKLNGYFNRASGSIWGSTSEAGPVDHAEPEASDSIEWLSDSPAHDEAFIPDVSRLMYPAKSLYKNSVEILLRCATKDDVSFWTEFLEQTPSDIDLYTCGIQALCDIEEPEFRKAVARLVMISVDDSFGIRNLIALRAMESSGVWSSGGLFVSALTDAVKILERPEKNKMIFLILEVSGRYGLYFEGAFSGLVHQNMVNTAAYELVDILFPDIKEGKEP